MELVQTRTLDGVNLKGFFFEGNSDKVVLIIPGINGNFIENDFFLPICKKLSENGINCLCVNTRGSFHVSTSLHPQNLEKPKKIGTSYEVFEECKYDIACWLDYLYRKGFEKIDLVSHCFGANKIIYYFNSDLVNDSIIDNIIFISPANLMYKLSKYPDYLDMIKEAKKNVEEGNPNKFIDCHLFYKSSISFLQLIASKKVDNLPLEVGSDDDFQDFKRINNKLSVIYGSNDKYAVPHINRIVNIANENTDINLLEIQDADHIFFGKEEELANCVYNELKIRYNNVKNRRI